MRDSEFCAYRGRLPSEGLPARRLSARLNAVQPRSEPVYYHTYLACLTGIKSCVAIYCLRRIPAACSRSIKGILNSLEAQSTDTQIVSSLAVTSQPLRLPTSTNLVVGYVERACILSTPVHSSIILHSDLRGLRLPLATYTRSSPVRVSRSTKDRATHRPTPGRTGLSNATNATTTTRRVMRTTIPGSGI